MASIRRNRDVRGAMPHRIRVKEDLPPGENASESSELGFESEFTAQLPPLSGILCRGCPTPAQGEGTHQVVGNGEPEQDRSGFVQSSHQQTLQTTVARQGVDAFDG